jgi:hypothetical protein
MVGVLEVVGAAAGKREAFRREELGLVRRQRVPIFPFFTLEFFSAILQIRETVARWVVAGATIVAAQVWAA